MRTQEEILDRIKERKANDILGFELPYYIESLTFENAKQFLLESITEADWVVKTEEDIKEQAIEYMSFAWDKANNCRGISAARSISHYIAWMWLLGYENTERWDNYEFYGKDILLEIGLLLGIDCSVWDDGERCN